MGAWLREKLVELGLNLIVLGLFLGVLFNGSPAWLEHPGAALAWLLECVGWLAVPVIAWVALKKRFGEVGPLVVKRFWDADCWPAVTWSEPRFDRAALLFKARRVTVRCYTREAEGQRQFCVQVANGHDGSSGADDFAVPLASIAGFSLTTAAQLYRTANQGGLSDGSHIILRAELDPPLPDGRAFIPLTFTAAAQGEVEALHRLLSLVFAPGGLAVRVALRASTSHGPGSAAIASTPDQGIGPVPVTL